MKTRFSRLPTPARHRHGAVRRGALGVLTSVALGAIVAVWAIRGAPAGSAWPELSQDSLVLIEDRLHAHGSDTPFHGFIVAYHPDGALRSRSQVVDGRLHGLSEGWFPEGQIETREHFVQGVSHGVRVRWHPNGQRAVRAEIRHGELHGLFQRWHANGQIAQIVHCENGEPHGLSLAYFPSGAPQARVEMLHGKRISQQFWHEPEPSRN